MFVSASLSRVRGFENPVGEQYLSGVRGASQADCRIGLYALRSGIVG